MTKLGVVIVTYNRLNLLKECIDAVLNQTYKFDEIYIVNNASTDGTREYLDSINKKNLNVEHLSENLGGSYGFFKGVEYFENSKIDYILLIDDDAIIDKDYNKNIVEVIKKNNKGIIAYSGTVKTNNEIQYNHRQYLKNSNEFVRINTKLSDYESEYFDYDISTFCGIYIPVKIIKKIGLPNKDFFIWLDDTEYCLRLLKYGKIRNVNNANLNHKTNITENVSYNWKSYYGLRNNIYILKKYFNKKQLNKFIFDMKIKIIGGKVLSVLKIDKYYNNIVQLYKDALNDGMNENLGKNQKYIPSFKLR